MINLIKKDYIKKEIHNAIKVHQKQSITPKDIQMVIMFFKGVRIKISDIKRILKEFHKEGILIKVGLKYKYFKYIKHEKDNKFRRTKKTNLGVIHERIYSK